MNYRKSYFLILGAIFTLHGLSDGIADASPSPAARASDQTSVPSDVGLFRNATTQKLMVESELLSGAMLAEIVPGDVGPLPIRDGGLITVSTAPYEGRAMVEMFKYVVHFRASRRGGKQRFHFVISRNRLESNPPVIIERTKG
jgi:hypothetical protein